MFEKSLYDLIRGLRNHKGNEKAYIQESLRECKSEIKGQDMDVKAMALLKLTYLEMFGHDMSWASFNVLEVMSSQKYHQKRVGYLAAVQTFRPDTEVLMLAENLLKKDLSSPQLTTISLPLVALPHVISRSMANSLLSDILPRLSHSSPAIRKKTIVTLYRLALVYPETLRPAWPKIKDRLLDENEDPTVTAAIVNVVCELGWRRPQDFLPLAPRLFDLLVDGNNNWMAIKIIKLFAHLTPLEPRLVRKLLPPLTTLIKTTPAMSLLYECINGIIQGGILKSSEGTREGDEIASLCVNKLRGMLIVEGDPNLKYVSILAFSKIVESHPSLVAQQEDVILECIDDPDISIRLRALDLVAGMVDSTNLNSIVDRLMRQLRNAPKPNPGDESTNSRYSVDAVVPTADSDDEDAEQSIRPAEKRSEELPPLPDDYRYSVVSKILEMCRRNTYANVTDFDWYIDTLVSLVKHLPKSEASFGGSSNNSYQQSLAANDADGQLAYDIGAELRNIAVRVRSSRREAVHAAERLISIDQRSVLFPVSGVHAYGVLEPVAWIVGEFSPFLTNALGLMASLTHSSVEHLQPKIVCAYIQAAIKIYSSIVSDEQQIWVAERKSTTSLLTNSVTRFLESLSTHSDLEVQERAVEYLELVRLASEAVSSQGTAAEEGDFTEPPLFLTQALPTLFAGLELNPVAADAQRKVPVPEGLDLEAPINENLPALLNVSGSDLMNVIEDEVDSYYNQRPKAKPVPIAEPAANRLNVPEPSISYQHTNGAYSDTEDKGRRRVERRERNRDDPFYIPSVSQSGRSSPSQNIFQSGSDDLDVDSIPVMELDLDSADLDKLKESMAQQKKAKSKKKPKRNIQIMGDENIDDTDGSASTAPTSARAAHGAATKPLLQLDSSGLGSLSLDEASRSSQLDVERREAEDKEMAVAMKEVERLRLEMQRAQERIEAKSETIIKRKKKKKTKPSAVDVEDDGNNVDEHETPDNAEKVKKKKKKKKSRDAEDQVEPVRDQDDTEQVEIASSTKTKKKPIRRRQITFDADEPSTAG